MVDPGELRDVFDRAVSLPPADRGPFLASACAHNEALRREMERLLGADAGGPSLFDSRSNSTPLTPSDAATSIDARTGPRAPALAPGMRLGPYEITAAVGAGGMGEVFKARDTRLDRTVATQSPAGRPGPRTDGPPQARARSAGRRRPRPSAYLHAARCRTPGRRGLPRHGVPARRDPGGAARLRPVIARTGPRLREARSPRRWLRPTAPASCIATSSPAT